MPQMFTFWPGTPVRDFIRQNVPGAAYVGNALQNIPITGPSFSPAPFKVPTFGQVNETVRGLPNASASEPGTYNSNSGGPRGVYPIAGGGVSGGQVLGNNTSGGGVTGGGNNSQSNSDGQTYYDQGAQQQPQQGSYDFDAMIAPALQALDEAMGPLQQGYNENVAGIQGRQATQQASTNQQIGAQQQTLTQAGQTQTGIADTAANEARRQFAEIQRGLQSRYGGTTGTGQFAESYAGAQTMRNMANIKQGLSQAMTEIDNKRQQVQEIGRIALQDIEDKTAEQIRQSKAQLDASLAQIRSQKGELQGRKAELAMNAMQFYQQSVGQVNAQNAAFKQNLIMSQQQADNALQMAIQKGQGVASSFTPYNLNFGDVKTPVMYNKQTGAYNYIPQPGGGAMTPQTGAQDQFGNLTPEEKQLLGIQ